jgi:hypothetical protein
MSERLDYHLGLLKNTQTRLLNASKQDSTAISEEILQQLQLVIDQLGQKTDLGYESGHDLLANIATHQPQLMPAIDRDLLWFFGGDCLHFLTDDELDRFQRLEDMAAAAESEDKTFDYQAAHATLR